MRTIRTATSHRSRRRLAAALGLSALALVVPLTACGGPSVEVQPTFSVVHSAPHHGAIEVGRDVVPYLAFSTAVGASARDHIGLEAIEADGASVVELTSFVDDQGLSVRLVPRMQLEPTTEYRLVVDADLVADNGAILGAAWASSFRTAED